MRPSVPRYFSPLSHAKITTFLTGHISSVNSINVYFISKPLCDFISHAVFIRSSRIYCFIFQPDLCCVFRYDFLEFDYWCISNQIQGTFYDPFQINLLFKYELFFNLHQMAVFQELMASRAVPVLEGELSLQAVRVRWKLARLVYMCRLHRTHALQSRPQERHQAGG